MPSHYIMFYLLSFLITFKSLSSHLNSIAAFCIICAMLCLLFVCFVYVLFTFTSHHKSHQSLPFLSHCIIFLHPITFIQLSFCILSYHIYSLRTLSQLYLNSLQQYIFISSFTYATLHFLYIFFLF